MNSNVWPPPPPAKCPQSERMRVFLSRPQTAQALGTTPSAAGRLQHTDTRPRRGGAGHSLREHYLGHGADANVGHGKLLLSIKTHKKWWKAESERSHLLGRITGHRRWEEMNIRRATAGEQGSKVYETQRTLNININGFNLIQSRSGVIFAHVIRLLQLYYLSRSSVRVVFLF